MEGLKCKCPSCKMIMHETTKNYKPDVRPNGSFLRLLDPWKGWGWSTYDDALGTVATDCSQMTCPSCSSPLAPTGRLTIVPSPFKTNIPAMEEKAAWVCSVCGKVCKSRLGLASHLRVHLTIN